MGFTEGKTPFFDYFELFPALWYPQKVPKCTRHCKTESRLPRPQKPLWKGLAGRITYSLIKLMQNKICLITGATTGIGYITALELARMGATVVGVGRNPDKADVAQKAIRSQTGNNRVEFLLGDLSLQKEVRRVADEFKSRYPRLDILINNAGALFIPRLESGDGIEMTMALNHLGYFLLTHQLLPSLEKAPSARIINVASRAHRRGHIDLQDLEKSRRYFGWSAYCQSKLANVLFTYELDRRLKLTGGTITANALHPGFVATGFSKNNALWYRILSAPVFLTAISTEKGAETSIYLASSPEVEGVSGKYFHRCKPVTSSPESYNETLAKHLWAWSAEKTGLPPG